MRGSESLKGLKNKHGEEAKTMLQRKINMAVTGLGFGGAFVPIHHSHPDVASVKVYDPDRKKCRFMMENGFADGVYESFEDILADPDCDAVHLVTPIPLHADQTVRVLNAGKHCACTVPMATSVEDLYRIAEAKHRSGKNYMMMETTLYTYQFFYVQEMLRKGELGKIQFLRGSHYQDMVNWPDYWMGLPPMWYGTHAIAPMVKLSGSRISRVNCFGSGTMEEWLTKQYQNPYPVESALFEFENGMKGEATRSLFECARIYQEGLFVYGSQACFEWGFSDGDRPYITILHPQTDPDRRGGTYTVSENDMPNAYESLPEPLWRFTVGENFDPLNPQDSLKIGAGGGHHGSHPHLVHEFVRSIVEEREPAIGVELGANITAAGVCAHQSAMNGGAAVVVPHII